jgi:pimeloyl-ACP methyl ester carboxylesterase
VYSQSAAARTVAIATTGTIRTRHGLVLLTTPLTHATHVSRVVVPGADTPDAIDPQLRTWADSRRLTVEPLAGRRGPDASHGGGGGFTAALQNLANHTDAATTSATAKMIGYPTTDLTLGSKHPSWRTVLLGLASLVLAVLIGRAPGRLARRRRRRSRELDPDFPDPRVEADWIAKALHAEVVMVPQAGHYPQSQSPQITTDAVLQLATEVRDHA